MGSNQIKWYKKVKENAFGFKKICQMCREIISDCFWQIEGKHQKV